MQAKALSSVYGRIRELAIAMKGEVSEETILLKYEKFLQAFVDRTQVLVLGKFAPETAEMAEDQVKRSLHRVIDGRYDAVLIDAVNYQSQAEANTQWIEDPFTVLSLPGDQVVLLEPFEFRRMQMAGQLSNGYDVLIKSTDLKLEGGNMLVGDDYVLIGEDLLARNLGPREDYPNEEEYEEARRILESRLLEALGIEHLIWVGLGQEVGNPLQLPMGKEARQPLFHLDMFLTLGGKSSAKEHQGDELIFVADLELDEPATPCLEGEAETIADRWEDLKTFQEQLNQMAELFRGYHLRHRGPRFDVRRFPIRLRLCASNPTIVYSYNNCLTEWYHGIKRIYLPDFEITCNTNTETPICHRTCIQCKLKDQLDGLGFRVTWVNASFKSFAPENGALNCMAKVLKRSEY